MDQHVLYGVEISYFTGKARAYLRWKGVPFEERPSDTAFYRDICMPRIGYPMIPLLITPEDIAIQDTTLIMDHFEARDPGFTPRGPVQHMVARLIELYADDWLLMPMMQYRWAYDAETTMLEFGMNLMPDASRDVQARVGAERAGPFRGALPLLGVHPETAPLVEASYLALLHDLDTHFRTHPFVLGRNPTVADFALAGALYAHGYRDATAGALMRREALAVARYVERMMMPNRTHQAPSDDPDDVPETLLPVLSRMMTEQMPTLVDGAARLSDWRQTHPGEEIPRSIGLHDFTLGEVTAQRAIRPYSTWLHGRARESYLVAGEAADQVLDACGGALFAATDISDPVALHNYKLVWAD